MSIGDGTKIKIKFTQAVIGNVSGLNPPASYIQTKIDLSNATFSALNQYSSSYPASYAFNGNVSDYWRGTTSANWIKVKLSKPAALTSFRLYMGSNYIGSFTISGSNDDSAWTQIGETFTGASSSTSQWYSYAVENDVKYLYYRLDTLSTYSSTVYLYEWELYETQAVGNEAKFLISFDRYDYVPGGSIVGATRTVKSVEANNSFFKKLNLDEFEFTNCDVIKGKISLARREEVNDG